MTNLFTKFTLYSLLTFSLLLRLAWPVQVAGQTSPLGVLFQKGDFSKVLATAQAAHKPLFVEVYLTGCPHCEALRPVLTDKRVGDFFNASFVSWQVEANAPESVALQKQTGLAYPEFPLFLFFDSEGQLIHVATPAEQSSKLAFVEEVIGLGRIALNPLQRTSGYASRFEAGDRDLSFLIQYGKYAKTRKDNARLHVISDALGQSLQQPEQIRSPAGFYCLQRLVDDIDNPIAVYYFSHLSEYTAMYPVKDVKEAGEGLIFRALYGVKGDQYSVQKISQMRAYMVALGVPVQEAAARTLLKELDAYLRVNDTPGAVQRFNEYRHQNTTIGVADYAYLMHYFNEKATDTSYLSEMSVWAFDGLHAVLPNQQNTKPIADLYYELAVACQKMGQLVKARENAQQAFVISQKAKIDTKKYEEQLRILH